MSFPVRKARQSVLKTDDVCQPHRRTPIRHRVARSPVEQWLARRDLRCDPPSLEAVNRNVPASKADYLPNLFRLARSLKFDAKHATAADATPAFRVWFFLSQPARPSVTFAQAERRFRRAFDAARTEPLAWLARIASGVMCDWWKGAARRLTGLLGAVARVRPVVYLSCRTLERFAGVPSSTAARWLNKLAADGVIRVVRKGVPSATDRTATVYDLSPLIAVKAHAERPKPLTRLFLTYGIDHEPPRPHDPADGPLWGEGVLCPTSAPVLTEWRLAASPAPDKPPASDRHGTPTPATSPQPATRRTLLWCTNDKAVITPPERLHSRRPPLHLAEVH